MQFDFDAETNELRKQSGFTSRVATTLFVTVLLSMITVGVALFAPEREIRDNPIPLFIFSAMVLLAGGFVALYYFKQAKQLIESGVVVKAELQSVTKLPKGWYRLTVSYELHGGIHRKSLNVASIQCGAIEGAGFVLLAVNPEAPSVAQPLYNYASRKDALDVMTGKRGLV